MFIYKLLNKYGRILLENCHGFKMINWMDGGSWNLYEDKHFKIMNS